ncbi:global regulator CLP-associated N-acetyltransferase [Lysobacter firmicutimachus]|uniref:Global regulator CLP-associated N-acetyltransferase n=1 Tax=Lysobacter firmicutimachus TaxID=1792846 RepID=A0AAU8MZF4_9GAMM|nr:global regulator CLP-associated N-acetyltransferase [Lysobacter antibioticus]
MGRVAPSAETAPRVRLAELGDASDVAELLSQLGYPCTRDEAAERIAVLRDDPRHYLLLAELDGHACGLVASHTRYSLTHGADLTRITALVVARSCYRQGIGRLLLREVERRARRDGVSRIEVTSNSARLEAHEFYRRCGYADGSVKFVKTLGD